MTRLAKIFSFTAIAAAALTLTPARAQNPAFTPGDLLLGFQLRIGTGSDQTVLVNLGDTASFFRRRPVNIVNLANVNVILNSTFGLGAGNSLPWYDNPDLFFGLAAVWNNSGASTALQNGDPSRTIYISKSRDTVGTEGEANSTIANVASNTLMTTAAGNVVALQNVLESGSISGTVAIPKSTANTWEDYNPFTGSAQSTAFGAFSGGIQQAFAAGAFGTFSMGTVEGALDLYRFQAVNNLANQVGFGEPLRTGEFEGTITISQSGQVNFTTANVFAVPEPSAALLGGFGMLALLGRRRRA